MRLWILLLSVVLLAGCGFQLRGTEAGGNTDLVLPIKAESNLGARIRQKLANMGISSEYNGGDYMRVLFLDEKRERSLLGDNGDVTEYLLTSTLTYQYVKPSADTPSVPKKLRVERTYRFNEDQLLASDTQQTQIQDEMLGDLLNQLLMRWRKADHSVKPRE
ncbi:LPS assembly lipoprotein LptE [Pokkaliibacter sp. CJK22405]|uniref:LPS-assembly lipoprotein LptE n=1 Tax=Pokkaliibacter sp. CJK22405 TaxID=3384615 RepID=UPI0039854911